MHSTKSGFELCEPACSRTIQNVRRCYLDARAHHRRCAREGLTGRMMPYVQASCKSLVARKALWIYGGSRAIVRP